MTFDLMIGATADENVALARAVLDRAIEEDMRQTESLLLAKGALEHEVEAFLAYRRRQLAQWRADSLGELQRWLTEPAAPSAKLH